MNEDLETTTTEAATTSEAMQRRSAVEQAALAAAGEGARFEDLLFVQRPGETREVWFEGRRLGTVNGGMFIPDPRWQRPEISGLQFHPDTAEETLAYGDAIHRAVLRPLTAAQEDGLAADIGLDDLPTVAPEIPPEDPPANMPATMRVHPVSVRQHFRHAENMLRLYCQEHDIPFTWDDVTPQYYGIELSYLSYRGALAVRVQGRSVSVAWR